MPSPRPPIPARSVTARSSWWNWNKWSASALVNRETTHSRAGSGMISPSKSLRSKHESPSFPLAQGLGSCWTVLTPVGSGCPGNRSNPHARCRQYGLDADLDRAGPAHDHSGTGAVLCRHGAFKECAVHHDAVLCHYGNGLRAVGRLWLFAGLRHHWHGTRGRQFQFLRGRPVQGLYVRIDARRSGRDHSRIGLRHFSDDLRHHYSGADRGRFLPNA